MYTGPHIVEDGLIYAIDAGSTRSYPGSGTTVTDLVGANTGALTNGVSYLSSNGGSFDFDGVDQSISVGNPAVLQNLTAGTIQAIYYRDASTGTYQMLFSDGGSNLELTYLGNTLQFYIGNSGLGYSHAVTGEWFFVTGTWASGSKKLYLNGSEVASGTNTGINTGSIARFIGGRGASFPFNGQIPSIKIYNRELSAAEVLQNYNAQESRFL